MLSPRVAHREILAKDSVKVELGLNLPYSEVENDIRVEVEVSDGLEIVGLEGGRGKRFRKMSGTSWLILRGI